MQLNLTLLHLLNSLSKVKSNYTLLSATALLTGSLTLHAQSCDFYIAGMDEYEGQNNAGIQLLSGSDEFEKQAEALQKQISFTNGLSSHDLDIDAETYPEASIKAGNSLIYAGYDNHESFTQNFVGNTIITTSGGYAAVLVGGNYGNAGGASFTGDTHLTVSTDTFIDICGASYLTHDVDSQFNGSTSVVITQLLGYYSGKQIDNWSIGKGAIAGGHFGGLLTGESTGTPSKNVITGDTRVTVDLAGKQGVFDKYITGGSALFGGIDSTINGSSNLTITNAADVTFSYFITGAGLSYSKVESTTPVENSGSNKSDITVASSNLTIDSGTYLTPVMGGGFSASGGDITTGNITVNLTGGTYHSYIAGGSGIGNTVSSSGSEQSDFTVGKLVSKDVVLNVSNITSKGIITGGHLIGGPAGYDSTEASSIGNITVTVGGYDEAGVALGGHYNSIYGGSRIISASSDLFTQGDIVVNLETGFIQNDALIVAAGLVSNELDLGNKTTVETKSTTVKIGQDMEFGTNVVVSGGYVRTTTQHAYPTTITGNKLLHFDDESYRNLAQTGFYEFDEVRVDQATAHVQLEGKTTISTLDAEVLTKSGMGELSVEAGTSRGTVEVVAGRMNITTDQQDSTVGELSIASGATASSDHITLSRDEVKGTGLSVNEITGAGTLESRHIDVKQDWKQQDLEVSANEQFSMTTGADVHLESLSTAQLHMEDSSQLRTQELLHVTSIHIDDYLSDGASSSPYISALDMLNGDDNHFTFNFSSETIANMNLNPLMEPYLLADLSELALETALDKSFTFQIDGQGNNNIQSINGINYFIGTLDEDIYIFTAGAGNNIPEPMTASLSLLALVGLAMRRRRK